MTILELITRFRDHERQTRMLLPLMQPEVRDTVAQALVTGMQLVEQLDKAWSGGKE